MLSTNRVLTSELTLFEIDTKLMILDMRMNSQHAAMKDIQLKQFSEGFH